VLDDRGSSLVDLYDSREDVVTTGEFVIKGLATVEDLSTLLLDFFKTLGVDLDGVLAVEGSAKGLAIKRVTDGDTGVSLDKLFDDGVEDLFVDEESSKTGTSLTTGTDSREQTALNGHFEVSVFEDGNGIVTTEFEDTLSESFSNLLGDSSTNLMMI